ncbi:MAG: response regulator [Geobacteraceae bacterium]|nr:response regulator [Geobacteraceae bacterium]
MVLKHSCRRLFRSVLEENGYTEATNGEEAIKLSSAIKILDVIMPQRNACEVYDAIKSEKPAIKIPFVSGHGEETIHESGIKGENVTILTKPPSLPGFLKQCAKFRMDNLPMSSENNRKY